MVIGSNADDEEKTFTVRKMKVIEDSSDEDFIWE
jgi:hypothetical protein